MKLIKVLGGITVVSCISLLIVNTIISNQINFSKIEYEWDDVEDMDF